MENSHLQSNGFETNKKQLKIKKIYIRLKWKCSNTLLFSILSNHES